MAVADDELRYILSMALTLVKAQSQALAELGAVLAKIAPENSEVLVVAGACQKVSAQSVPEIERMIQRLREK